MNYDIIERLFEELYAPKLTPFELLENARLSNYISVNFHSEDNYLIGVTKCFLETGDQAEYIYTFNSENMLISINENIRNEIREIYNRYKEINGLYNKVSIKNKVI
ncbi:hypothetical protein NST02_18345 [Robertmurraya sp. FSL W8-0741]|uniref:hypothetical protein n=1 Tax=Robertmurraya sp. FSL W8-0741 TaxID=2954629 RepID=UPI0030FC0248